MNDDETLRRTIAGADPAPADRPVDPPTSPSARALVERIMSTPVQAPETAAVQRRPRRLIPALGAGAAAGALAVALGTGVVGGGPDATPSVAAGRTLDLTLPGNGIASMCIRFEPAMLTDVPIAFEGTVTAVEGDAVVLDVDRWYRGGGTPEATTVRLANPANEVQVALDGVTFEPGVTYLVSASTEGGVNGCGMSGQASDPTLAAAFEQVFGG